jgi:hypothetical protein
MRELLRWLCLGLLGACIPAHPTAPVELVIPEPRTDTATGGRSPSDARFAGNAIARDLAGPRSPVVDTLLVRLVGMDQSTRTEDRARWIRLRADTFGPATWTWIRPLGAGQFVEIRPQAPDWFLPLPPEE